MAWQHRAVGVARRLWWRVRRPRTMGVRAIVLDGHGRVALVRHTYLDGWYLPGGGIERRESADAAVRRELAEEVALTDVTIERVLSVYHNAREGKDDHIVVFVVRAGEASALSVGDPLEIAEVRWCSVDCLPEGTSPATRRRIDDYRSGAIGTGAW